MGRHLVAAGLVVGLATAIGLGVAVLVSPHGRPVDAGLDPRSAPVPADSSPRSGASAGTSASASGEVPSNILPGDYVGPEACKGCHGDVYARWRAHPHSRMNQNADDTTVHGDFSGVRASFPAGDVVFARGHERDAGYTMSLERAGKLVRRYVVTRTIGSRFMQFYIGRQVEGPEPKTNGLYSVEHKLPFAYWYKLKRWLPEDYFDPFGPETTVEGTPLHDRFDRPEVLAYNENCMVCHNTYAYLYRLGQEAPRQGFGLDELRFSAGAVFSEIAKTVDMTGIGANRGFLRRLSPDKHLVTLGISCESCHFGGREHVKTGDPNALVPEGRYVKVAAARSGPATSLKDAHLVNAICRQCHSAAGGTYPNGAGSSNSRDSLDMLAGACASAIKCTDCHDPHTTIGPEAQPDAPKHLAQCVRCHEKYADPKAQAAHGGHPASAAVSCLDCHMPRVVQGLDEVVRSHRIGSPTDPRMLSKGLLNACNLCHLDKPIGWTLEAFATRWGKRVAPASGWAGAYGGDLATPVGKVWLTSADSGVRMAAVQAYGRSPLGKAALHDVAAALDDPFPVNRVFASFAVERITREKLGIERYDPAATPATRERQISALLARSAGTAGH